LTREGATRRRRSPPGPGSLGTILDGVPEKETAMSRESAASTTATFELLLADRRRQPFVLRLYVTGMTPLSMRAVATTKSLCEAYFRGRYDLEVINLLDHPELAREHDIIAAPTLVRERPLPRRRLVGDLSNRERAIMVLREGEPEPALQPATREQSEETPA
jgi:circadian clock protein KaiB